MSSRSDVQTLSCHLKKTPLTKQAVWYFRRSALQENALGQYFLARAYELGKGTDKDCKEAFDWFKRSADNGHNRAAYSLGCAYDQGNGVSRDEVQATYWFRQAADAGDKRAMERLGHRLIWGIGVDKDEKLAQEWYAKSVEIRDATIDCLETHATTSTAAAVTSSSLSLTREKKIVANKLLDAKTCSWSDILPRTL